VCRANQQDQSSQWCHTLKYVCALQFIGTFLFAFFGGAASGGVAAPANGIALAVLGKF